MGQSTSRQRFKQPKDLRDEPRAPARATKQTWNERFADLTPEQQQAHLDSHRRRGQRAAASAELAAQLEEQARDMKAELAAHAEKLALKQHEGLQSAAATVLGNIEQRLYERLESRMVELVTRLAGPVSAAASEEPKHDKPEKSSEKKKG